MEFYFFVDLYGCVRLLTHICLTLTTLCPLKIPLRLIWSSVLRSFILPFLFWLRILVRISSAWNTPEANGERFIKLRRFPTSSPEFGEPNLTHKRLKLTLSMHGAWREVRKSDCYCPPPLRCQLGICLFLDFWRYWTIPKYDIQANITSNIQASSLQTQNIEYWNFWIKTPAIYCFSDQHGRQQDFFPQGWAIRGSEGRKSPARSRGSSPVGVWWWSPRSWHFFQNDA